MTFAWTTLVVVLMIQAGFAFFLGLHTQERHPRGDGQARALVELALATFVATLIHCVFFFGFVILQWIPGPIKVIPIFVYFLDMNDVGQLFSQSVPMIGPYILFTCAIGWYSGYALSIWVISGKLRVLATHRWVYDLLKYRGQQGRYINAYVLTKTVEEKKNLMYTGYLEEIYLGVGGTISNLVLFNCSRFYMKFTDDGPETSERVPLSPDAVAGDWNLFSIGGDQIANALFNQTPPIDFPSGTSIDQAIEDAAVGPRLPDDWDAERVADAL